MLVGLCSLCLPLTPSYAPECICLVLHVHQHASLSLSLSVCWYKRLAGKCMVALFYPLTLGQWGEKL